MEPKLFGNLESEPKINLNTHFMQSVWTLEDASRVSELEPGYLAGDGAVTLARVRLRLKYLPIHANYMKLNLI